MPIQPLDLQIMFSRLTQVGKEHAGQKDTAQAAQALQGSAIVKNADQQTHSVPESRDLGDGVEKSGPDGRKKDERKDKDRAKPSDDDQLDKEVITDPDLGTHIDITG